MSWTEFKRLTEGFADPCISLIGLEESIKDELQQGDFELIITGTNRRTSETGKYIKKYLLMKSTLIQKELFNEIPSRIDTNLSDHEYRVMKNSGELRIQKHRVLSSKDTYALILKIHNFIKYLKVRSVLVISSSYLIGQLNYFYNYFDLKDQIFDIYVGEKYEIGGWLKGFEVNIF